MITCAKCKERLYPENPELPTGKYHHSTCDYFCNKPSYYRELEAQSPPEVETIVKHVSIFDFAAKRQVAKLYRLEEDMEGLKKYLQQKLAERDKPKMQGKKIGYRGIK